MFRRIDGLIGALTAAALFAGAGVIAFKSHPEGVSVSVSHGSAAAGPVVGGSILHFPR
jgi:hypothetical protein